MIRFSSTTVLAIATVGLTVVSPVFAQDSAQNVNKAKTTLNKIDTLLDGVEARQKSASMGSTRTVVQASTVRTSTKTVTAKKKDTTKAKASTNTKKKSPKKP